MVAVAYMINIITTSIKWVRSVELAIEVGVGHLGNENESEYVWVFVTEVSQVKVNENLRKHPKNLKASFSGYYNITLHNTTHIYAKKNYFWLPVLNGWALYNYKQKEKTTVNPRISAGSQCSEISCNVKWNVYLAMEIPDCVSFISGQNSDDRVRSCEPNVFLA